VDSLAASDQPAKQIVWNVLPTIGNQSVSGDFAPHPKTLCQTNERTLSVPPQNGVTLVDHDFFCEHYLHNENIIDESTNRIRGSDWPPMQRVALLWYWAQTNTRDVLWYSELGFQGLVYNAESLDRWARVALDRIAGCDPKDDGLTGGIELPHF
jgi:hypothetical protein